MKPASFFGETIRVGETSLAEDAVQTTRECLSEFDRATRDHVARHYRAIALPALAAATQRVAALRANRNSPARPRG